VGIRFRGAARTEERTRMTVAVALAVVTGICFAGAIAAIAYALSR
jgi:hypothetical protein